jgi:hypothetical protein
MRPNYVSLINETLCPNRKDAVEKMARKHFCVGKAGEVFGRHSFARSWSKTETFSF